MLRKITALAMAFAFLFSTLASAQSGLENTVMGKLNAAENALYGNAQTGALLDRLSKFEMDFYGAATTDAMVDKVDRIYADMFDNADGEASVLTKVNAIEWSITHAVTGAPLKTRIENLETLIEGSPNSGAYSERIGMLTSLAFSDGMLSMTEKTVDLDTLIKIRLLTPIDSKTASVGDKIAYQVAEDVIVEGALVFAKGAEGAGTITKVSQSQNFGRDAKVEVSFDQTTAIDGAVVETYLGEKAKKEMESMALAAGASVAGMALLGPVGIVTGAFVKGKNINIPEGTEMYIQTKSQTLVHGIQTEVL